MRGTFSYGLLAAGCLVSALPWAAAAQERGRPQLTPEQIAQREKDAQAESDQQNMNRAPADPRDFTGVWWTRGYDRTFRPITNPRIPPREAINRVPLTPKERESWQRHVDMEEAGTPLADAPTQCFPHGVPRIIASPYPIQFIYSPGMITILHEVGHNVRYIHMDGKPAPADTPHTFLGYSVGYWDGDTLVIETTHLNDRTRVDEEGLSHGDKLKVTERITKSKNQYGGAELRNLITIDDPDHFTSPWTAERIFAWRGDLRISEYSCEENNRNKPVDGVTVAL